MIEQQLEDEKYKIKDSKTELQRELDQETTRRQETEEAYERLKEELIKMEL